MTRLAPMALGLLLVGGSMVGCGGDDDGGETGRTPVVFAHGCPPPPFTSEDDAGIFTGETIDGDTPGFTEFFVDNGYKEDEIFVFVYPDLTCPPNFSYRDELTDYVNGVISETGVDRVDLIGFSMGGIAGRLLIAEQQGALIEDFVTIAGPHHGSILAGMVGAAGQDMLGEPNYEGALEVAPPYACEGESTDTDIQFVLNGCLTTDGRTTEMDETPYDMDSGGEIRYLAIRNDKDDLVIPTESACLNMEQRADCSDPVNMTVSYEAEHRFGGNLSAHVETQIATEVRQATFDFLNEPRL